MRMQISLAGMEVKPPKRESVQRGLSFQGSQLGDMRSAQGIF